MKLKSSAQHLEHEGETEVALWNVQRPLFSFFFFTYLSLFLLLLGGVHDKTFVRQPSEWLSFNTPRI